LAPLKKAVLTPFPAHTMTDTPNPFETRSLPVPGFFRRLLGRAEPGTAFVEIENLLASRHPTGIWPAEVSAIATNHGLSPSDLHLLSMRLWREAVAEFVADDTITADEADFMAALRRVLQIGEDDAIAVEKAIIHPRYHRRVTEALADDKLTSEERDQLELLARGLRLSPGELELLYGPPAQEALERKLEAIIEDRRVSPEELAELGRTADNMGIKASLAADAEATVRRYAEYWKIENGEIPRIDDIPIRLQKGETCHFSADARWLEPRSKTVTTDLGSIGYSFRIARGVYYRSPRIRATRVKQDVLTELDTGKIYFTNKRVIFDGVARNRTLKLDSLLGFEVWEDAIKLEKPSGRSPIVAIAGDVERAAVVLGALAARA
jgi:hypothetical protein